MKKSAFLFVFFVLISSFVAAQSNIKVRGNGIYIGKSYQFDIVTTGVITIDEATVKNKNGDPVLTFVLNRKPTGYSNNSYYNGNGFNSNSGVSYTYYYHVADGTGNFCEVPASGLMGVKGLGTYIINNNLMQNGEFSADTFLKFCNMHGATFSGKY